MAADVSIIVETNAKEVGNEFTGMAGQIVGTVAKIQMLKKTMDSLSDAMNNGRIDGQQYSKAIAILDKAEDQLYASIGKANTAVKAQSAAMDQASAATTRASGTMSQAAIRAQQMAAAQRMAGKSTNKFGLISQQVGYQVGDFFVQVQSGTDALVAFGQQGTQLAGLLPGLAGAILGIGLSLGTAMLNASLTAKGLRVDFKAVFDDLKKAVEPIQPLIDAIGSALSYMGQVAVTVFQALIDNLDRVVAYTTAFAALLTGKLVYGFVAAGGAATAFFTLLKRGLISTGIGAIAVAIGEVILAFTKVVSAVGGVGQAFKTLGEIAGEVFKFESVKNGILSLNARISGMFFSLVVTIGGVFTDILTVVLEPMNKIGGVVMGTVEGIKSVWNVLPDFIGNVGKKAANLFIDALETLAQGAIDAVNLVIEAFNKVLEWMGADKFAQVFGFSGQVPTFEDADLSGLKLAYTDAGQSAAEKFMEGFSKGYDDSVMSTPVLDTLNKIIVGADTTAKAMERIADYYGDKFLDENPRLAELLSKLKPGEGIDPSDWLISDTDTKGGSKGSKSSAKTFSELLDKLRGETANQEKLIGLYGERREALEQIMSFEDELKRKLTENEALKVAQAAEEKFRIEERAALMDTVHSNIKSAFMSMVDGSETVADAFKNMLRNILLAVYEQQVATPAANAISGLIGDVLGGITGVQAEANGGAYSASGVRMFANGGVVTGPTGFRHSGGLGVMGEAGPEAIMPLKRGKNGKLGVQAEGGGTVVVNQNFNFQANGDESVKRIIGQAMPQIAQYTTKTIVDQRRKGGSMKSAFRG